MECEPTDYYFHLFSRERSCKQLTVDADGRLKLAVVNVHVGLIVLLGIFE